MRLDARLTEIDFAPDSVQAEVRQNVQTILATRAGTVPLDRDLGISWEFIDKPINVARAAVNHEIVRKIQRYEPRATVKSVQFNGRDIETGGLSVAVEIEVQV